MTQYKEKELKIMRALLGLLKDGCALYEIKASDIAQKAGIGKGTLYNYFESKEDIIAKTVEYSLDTTIRSEIARLAELPGFREKCYAILGDVDDIIHNESSDFHLLLFNVGGREMSGYCGCNPGMIQKYLRVIFDHTISIARVAVEEGCIPPFEDEEYVYSAFASALMGFVHARCRMQGVSEAEIGRAKDNAWKFLLKALH
ncbi:MAG: TetR/AcrR family transcriptional regulator [Christensenella sp.]|nr:TetR/AcrR family transcriptional regulator [Christensenella sp.]